MALLLFTSPITSLCSPSSSPRVGSSTAHPFFRFCNNSITLQLKPYAGCKTKAPFVLNTRGCVLIVKASTDVDGTESTAPEPPTPPPDSKVENVSIENLPLESKLQLNLEQKMKMKLAKKIRLRRKRLVRKRHLRKKGRWPPSKMKKNKNV